MAANGGFVHKANTGISQWRIQVFFWLLPDPPPAHLFSGVKGSGQDRFGTPPFRPVVDTPLLVSCCLSYILKKHAIIQTF